MTRTIRSESAANDYAAARAAQQAAQARRAHEAHLATKRAAVRNIKPAPRELGFGRVSVLALACTVALSLFAGAAFLASVPKVKAEAARADCSAPADTCSTTRACALMLRDC